MREEEDDRPANRRVVDEARHLGISATQYEAVAMRLGLKVKRIEGIKSVLVASDDADAISAHIANPPPTRPRARLVGRKPRQTKARGSEARS